MASKQFLRRLPLFSRERLNQLNLNPGAFPDVANDVLPIVTGSSESSTSPRPPLSSPVAGSVRTVLKPGALPQTLGQWSQRLSHLQSLPKPLSTLALTSPGADSTRPGWAPVPEAGHHSSPTDIAAATLPAIAGLLKHKLPVPTVSAISYEPKVDIEPASKAAATATAPVVEAKAVTSSFPATSSTDDVLSAAVSVSTDDSSPSSVRPLLEPLDSPQHQQSQRQPQAAQQSAVRRATGNNARGSNAASSSIQLNKHIMACRNTEELLALVQHRGAFFDYFNISTALARVPKLALVSPAVGHGSYHLHGVTASPPLPPPLISAPASAAAAAAAVLPSDIHLDAAGRSLLDHLAQLMVTQVDSFDARGLANSAWAFGKLKYVPSGGLPSVIAQAALRRMPEFSPQNLSNLVWSFVYMHHADEVLLSAASRFVCARVGEFKPQELANIVWAFASLGHRDDQMLHVAAKQAQRIAPLFKEQELSNMLWALGKMSLRDQPQVLEALMEETRVKLPAFLPQGISNVAWALASVGHPDMQFLDQVVAQCGNQLAAFDVQALANLVWAMASLGYYKPQFVGAVVNECLGRGLDRLSPQNLSNILWGCATLNHRDQRYVGHRGMRVSLRPTGSGGGGMAAARQRPHQLMLLLAWRSYEHSMLSSWAAQTLDKLASFEPQGVSNTAWAFARLGFHSPQLFQALSAAALHKIEGFTAQGLSNLAWAMATAGHVQPRLFEALARHATSLAPSFNAQNCSVTLWACATLRHHDDELFNALLERLVAEVDTCEPQNVANALWAVARMGHPLPRERAAPLVCHASRLLGRMNQQELCNTMWAVACLDLMDEILFATFCSCLQRLADISPEGMHQAYHAQLMYHSSLARRAGMSLAQLQQLAASNPPASLGLLPCLSEPLRTVAASMWAASARDVHVSRFHQEVSGALAGAGVPHALEWMTDDQHFSVDIGLQVNSKPVAVEVNGSHHYASNAPHRALGDTAVRRRMLEDRGWHVVDVGFAEWEAMGRTAAERGSNLVGRIAASLDDWDWRFVGLPHRSPSATIAPPPAAVVSPTPPTPAPPAAADVSLQQTLAAAMGLGPIFSSTPALSQTFPFLVNPFAAAAAAASSTAATSGRGIWAELGFTGLGLSQQPLGTMLGDAVTGTPAVSAGMELNVESGMERTGSLGVDAQSVLAAVNAAEALCALPGGNRLLAQQMYDVLGVRLPAAATRPSAAVNVGRGSSSPSDLATVMAHLSALQDGFRSDSSLTGRNGSGSASLEEDLVSDDDLERVVQYALT
ncbi:hypothetical protein VOLCADRAFT_87862 [Volvox carteri f. nagariensis]|uniref:RAP domain-containing protein n=1 Tax=Volvox carteri f. nagariensis TaxID=3068 RepID=D8TMF6_VOLCA|nr:uncharacterized protein VOLCADRAFT_87862 [Volvox carteri f. nagariensis]EFJ51245.1 hypothetical protein VOLCADRAFT_87862 [Volvox carteri f. nagariensis]|eukprot:XP_002947712.1 hypothetical protein VOLCADRAFT_87862 [Volvox carteri f. nagariensis]